SALAAAMLFVAAVASTQDYAAREKLRAESAEFRKDVVQVADGVYVAGGYAASNVILIQGNAGSIIVDTATDPTAARAIRDAFGARSGIACARQGAQSSTPTLIPTTPAVPVSLAARIVPRF